MHRRGVVPSLVSSPCTKEHANWVDGKQDATEQLAVVRWLGMCRCAQCDNTTAT